MRKLVASWIAAERDYHKLALNAAIAKLNAVLGMHVTRSRVSEWRRGKQVPSTRVVSQMLARSLPRLLKQSGILLTDTTLELLKQQLWEFGKEGQERVRYLL